MKPVFAEAKEDLVQGSRLAGWPVHAVTSPSPERGHTDEASQREAEQPQFKGCLQPPEGREGAACKPKLQSGIQNCERRNPFPLDLIGVGGQGETPTVTVGFLKMSPSNKF